ncbi:MAG: hypothetical protein HOP28_00520 [Gemmatimonadales bacterium]|nr:hypothetical protein [Gemmatimonadales bacterium]
MLAAAVFASTTAQAQSESRPQTRNGFWIGFGLGYGSLGCEDCDDRAGAGSAYFKLGGTVSQRLLIGGEFNGWTKKESGVTLSYSHASGVVYFYPSARGGLYLKGGAGIATIRLDAGPFGDGSTTGAGIILGIGYDARVGRNFSLTPYFNMMGGSFDGGSANMAQFGLGFSWH